VTTEKDFMMSLQIPTLWHWACSIPKHWNAPFVLGKCAISMMPRMLQKPLGLFHLTKRWWLVSLSVAQFQASSLGDDDRNYAIAKEQQQLLMDDKLLGLGSGIRNVISRNRSGEGEGEEQRMLFLDGNAILSRAYFKIMARVAHGGLRDMGSEGDWVLTVFRALSMILHLLEVRPTHVAAVFDYEGLTFRHEIFRGYKQGRPPIPDTIRQSLECFKSALLAMGISVLEVPGVEADDVIGALSLRAVKDPRMKVRIASPDRDFFQILSTQLRILRFPSKGSGIVSFGLEEFAQRFGSIQPTQFVDVIALTGDKVDNIPGVAGIGEKTALKLVQEFGSVENLLERRSEVVLKRVRESLMLDDGGILLSKRLLSLKVDLPAHILPHTLDNFVCQIPKDQGENFMKLLQAMERYVDSSISQDLEKKVHKIWKRWQGPKSLAPIIERLES